MSRKFKRRPVPVTTDGQIKIGETVAYNTRRDTNYRGDQPYIKAIVKSINKLNWASNRAYEYKLDIGGLEFWVDHNKVRKLRDGENIINYSYGKFKVGEEVYYENCDWYNVIHELVTILSAKIEDGKIVYEIGRNGDARKRCVKSENLHRNKIKVEDGVFKVGDYLKHKYVTRAIIEKTIVNDVYKFEEDDNVYYTTNGYYNSTLTSYTIDRWELCKPPVIVVSEIDPYGEEDWGEE